MIITLFEPIFNVFGFAEFLLTPTELLSRFTTLTAWYDILCPDILISWLLYLAVAYMLYFTLFVIPWRFFKKIIHVPKRRG